MGDVPEEIGQGSTPFDLEEASVLTGEYYGEQSPEYDHNNNSSSEQQHRYAHYRAWVEKKMEARRLEEEQQLTFKPKLHEYKGNVAGADDGSSRFDRLYNDARKRHVDAKILKAQAEEPQGTFQPQLVTRSSSRSKRSPSPQQSVASSSGSVSRRAPSPQPSTASKRAPSPNTTSKRAPSPQPIHEKLYTQTGAGNAKPVAGEEHPFHPAITRKALEITRNQSTDISERLFQKSFEIKERMERKRTEVEEKQQQNEDCTFTPKLVPKTRSLSANRARKVSDGQTPPGSAAERLLKYEEQKKARLELLRQTKMEVESTENTFTPTLVAARGSASYRADGSTTVFDRLSNGQAASTRNGSPENPEFTFKPSISKTSRDMTPNRTESDKSLHVRLYDEAEKKKRDLQLLAEHVLEDEKKTTTFSPMLISKQPSTLENRKPVFERLTDSSEKKNLHEVMSQIRDELEMSECTFQPAVTAAAAAVAKSDVPVHLRLNAEAERLKALALEREEQRQSVDSFKPVINEYHSDKKRTTANVTQRLSVGSSSSTPSRSTAVASSTTRLSNSRSSTPTNISSSRPSTTASGRTTPTRASASPVPMPVSRSRASPSPTPSTNSMMSSASSRRASASPVPTSSSSRANAAPSPAPKSTPIRTSAGVSAAVTTPRTSASTSTASASAGTKTPMRSPSVGKSSTTTPARSSTTTPVNSTTAASATKRSTSATRTPVAAASTSASRSAVKSTSTATTAASTPVHTAPPPNKVLKGRAKTTAGEPTTPMADSNSNEIATPVPVAESIVVPLQEPLPLPVPPPSSASSTLLTPTNSARQQSSSPLPPPSSSAKAVSGSGSQRTSPVPFSNPSATDSAPPNKVLRGGRKADSRSTSPMVTPSASNGSANGSGTATGSEGAFAEGIAAFADSISSDSAVTTN